MARAQAHRRRTRRRWGARDRIHPARNLHAGGRRGNGSLLSACRPHRLQCRTHGAGPRHRGAHLRRFHPDVADLCDLTRVRYRRRVHVSRQHLAPAATTGRRVTPCGKQSHPVHRRLERHRRSGVGRCDHRLRGGGGGLVCRSVRSCHRLSIGWHHVPRPGHRVSDHSRSVSARGRTHGREPDAHHDGRSALHVERPPRALSHLHVCGTECRVSRAVQRRHAGFRGSSSAAGGCGLRDHRGHRGGGSASGSRRPAA